MVPALNGAYGLVGKVDINKIILVAAYLKPEVRSIKKRKGKYFYNTYNKGPQRPQCFPVEMVLSWELKNGT